MSSDLCRESGISQAGEYELYCQCSENYTEQPCNDLDAGFSEQPLKRACQTEQNIGENKNSDHHADNESLSGIV